MSEKSVEWWVRGLLFENCNCRLLCRCHISYHQPADYERCIGSFAIDVAEGRYGEIDLSGTRAFLAVDAPQQMLEGDWTVALLIDERAESGQRIALEAILSGNAGGSWGVLGGFVKRHLPTRYVPIHLEADAKHKRMWAEGVFDTAQDSIRGADKANEVRLENIHNQVHGSSQVLALGSTNFETEGLVISTKSTHAISSKFSWRGP